MSITEAERSFIKKLDSMYKEGAAARDKAAKNWSHAIDVIRGRTWGDKRPKYKIPAVMNFIGPILERKAALLTDSRPTVNITSRSRGIDPLCQLLQKTTEGIFEECGFEQKLAEFVMLEQHFGTCYTNTVWDQLLDFGRGDIDLVVTDPRFFVFDPFVHRMYKLRNAEYCCLDTVRPTELLKEIYPDRSDEIKSDYGTGDSDPSSIFQKLKEMFFPGDSDEAKTSVIPRSVVREYWYRDRTSKGEDGQRMFKSYRHTIKAGGCIVEDGINPYIDGGHPFDGMEWGFDVNSPYGINEVEALESPQVIFNKILATIAENAIAMGNGIWLGDRNALTPDQWKKLSNEPGTQIQTTPGSKLERIAPTPLPTYMMATLTMLAQGIEKLSGITEVTEGRKPGQVTSGVAIESLAIMAQTVIRLKARQLESLIERNGQKLISRIFQHFTEDRVFNIVGKGGGFEQYKYERQLVREQIDKVGLAHMLMDYRFKVVPASSLAMTKWQKGLMATQLLQIGAIDRQEVLEAVEWPNREEVLKRTKEAQARGEEGMQKKGAKLPKSMLRGGHKETGMQLPQDKG